MRQVYDRPTTGIVSCKSNLQFSYDCCVRPKNCRRILKHVLKRCDNRSRNLDFLFPNCQTHPYTRFENGCSENSTQKLLTKYSTEEKNKHLFAGLGRSVLGKTVPSVLSTACTQDLWHSFSQYGPPGRQITYIFDRNVRVGDFFTNEDTL